MVDPRSRSSLKRVLGSASLLLLFACAPPYPDEEPSTRPTNEEWLEGKDKAAPTTQSIPHSAYSTDAIRAFEESVAIQIDGDWDVALKMETDVGSVGITIDEEKNRLGGPAPDCALIAILDDGTEVTISTLVIDGGCP